MSVAYRFDFEEHGVSLVFSFCFTRRQFRHQFSKLPVVESLNYSKFKVGSIVFWIDYGGSFGPYLLFDVGELKEHEDIPVHECHHAADMLWTFLKGRDGYEKVDPDEFRATMTSHLHLFVKRAMESDFNLTPEDVARMSSSDRLFYPMMPSDVGELIR